MLRSTTGLATAWNPGADDEVLASALSGSTLYSGGWFTSIGGQPRHRIAALDAATGLASAWDPDADGAVYTIAPGGSTVYAGGRVPLHRRAGAARRRLRTGRRVR